MFYKLVSQPGRLAIATIYIITPIELGRLAWLLNKGDKDDSTGSTYLGFESSLTVNHKLGMLMAALPTSGYHQLDK